MPAFQGDELYRTADQILAEYISSWQAAIPDVWTGEDGTLMILLQIDAGQMEGLYLANQLLLEDMFIQSASFAGLLRHGEMLGVAQGQGSTASGSLLFSGEGGTYIPTGTEAAFDPGGGQDILYYSTTLDGTLPNPGAPVAPAAADAGAGNLTGTFEWVVSFLTASGETLPSLPSNALALTARQATITNIPLGGPGTTGRRIYRSLNGGVYQLVTTLNDNTTNAYTDNIATPTGTNPVVESTAEQLSIPAQSEDTGAQYNAIAGAITVLSDAPDGLTDVTNPQAFTGGADAEDIEHYRTRLLNWLRSPQSGSAQDLVNWAETVDGVDTASAFPNVNLSGVSTPGTVVIRISGPGGTVPSSDVVNAVQALLNSFDLANITIIVGTFTTQTLNVTVTIVPAPNNTTATLTPTVVQAINAYINSIPVGGTAYISGIIDAVYGLSGVSDVTVQAPASNQTVSSSTKFIPGTITVNGTP